jgi:hypothetical protein
MKPEEKAGQPFMSRLLKCFNLLVGIAEYMKVRMAGEII